MKEHIICLLASIAVIPAIQLGAEADPNDHSLTTYPLTEEQFGRFSTCDGKPSPFWTSAWDGRDYIEMTPSKNPYTGWKNPGEFDLGDDDAKLIVKTAGNASGMFFYFEIHDDTFLSGTEWTADVVDIYLDTRSPEQIKSLSEGDFALAGTGCGFTTSSTQLQMWTMDNEDPADAVFSCFNLMLYEWRSNQRLSREEMNSQYKGMQFEVFGMDDNKRGIELYVPWKQFNGYSGPEGKLGGQKLSMAGGYNDTDEPETEVAVLRWRDADPWASEPGATSPTQLALNSWCTLLMDDDMPEVSSSPRHPEFTVGIEEKRIRSAAMIRGEISESSRFLVNGQRIESPGTLQKKIGLIVERAVLEDGSIVTSRKMICR